MPGLNIPADTWSHICWIGSLNGKATLVLSAYEEAVTPSGDALAFSLIPVRTEEVKPVTLT